MVQNDGNMSSISSQFRTVAEIAEEIRRRLKARRAGLTAHSAGETGNGDAVRIAELVLDDDRSFVRSLYQRVVLREPSEEELASALGHLRTTTHVEFAREFASSAEARDKGRVIYELLKPSEQARFAAPILDPSIPPIDRRRKVYSVDELLAYGGASFVTHVYRCVLKRDPDRASLVAHLEALESGNATCLDLLAGLQQSAEAKRIGVLVVGLPSRVADRNLPAVAPIDVEKKQYTLTELASVPSSALVLHLFRTLFKREPDSAGAANLASRLQSGEATADLVLDLSRSPEARDRGVQVAGLGWTRLRRAVRGVRVLGPLVEIAACLVYLPELARQFRQFQRMFESEDKEPFRKPLESVEAQIAALRRRVEMISTVVATQPQIHECIALSLLDGKVGYEQLSRALSDKVDKADLDAILFT
jgi:hypothetical protein